MTNIFYPLLCYYPSQAGGTANAIFWLNNTLDKNNFSCEVISTQFGLVKSIDSKNYSKNHKAIFLRYKGLSYIKYSFKKLKNSEIVQFSSLFFPPTLPILILAILRNKTIIISPRGELYNAAISQKAFKKKIWIRIIKNFQKLINFHATNNFELELIQRTFPKAKSISIIPNYIEMPKRHLIDVNMSFVFIGRINPIKNIHLLISAISKVHEFYPNIKLDILGSARLDYEISYLEDLKKQIKDNSLEKIVYLRGHLEGDIKDKIIASSKALILPSKSENFGNVILEAIAQGTPAIASKNTPWELLEEHKSGMWVDATVESLTSSMLYILNLNEKEYQQMRKNSFDLCDFNFNVKKNINVWEKYYNNIKTYV